LVGARSDKLWSDHPTAYGFDDSEVKSSKGNVSFNWRLSQWYWADFSEQQTL